VHTARRLKAVVATDELLLEEAVADKLLANHLAAHGLDELDTFLEGQPEWTGRYWEGTGSNWLLMS
jgi:hypothetical protein